MSSELALILFITNVSMFLLVQYLQEKKMNIETKLIKCKMELDKIALRDPITVQQVSIRKLWERVRSILVRRYKRLEDQEKKMFEINLSDTKNQDIKDLTQPLQFNSEKELLEIIDKSFDRFSFNGDGKWQSIGNEDRKKMKLSKRAVQDYYQYRRIALALKELIETKQEKKMTKTIWEVIEEHSIEEKTAE